jgi:hypothetical protein
VTTTRIVEEIGQVRSAQPSWARIPDAAREGVCRSKLYQLIREGKIRSVCLREEGKVRGTRLVNLQSLRDYIAGFENIWSGKVPPKKNGGRSS